MRRPADNTTSLPKQLREQLGFGDDFSRNGGPHKPGPAGRKERRKAEREEKKQQNQQRNPPQRRVPEARNPPERHFVKVQRQPSQNDAIPPRSILKKSKPREKSPTPPPPTKTSKITKEDAEIAALEKKLGLKGSKKLPKSFAEDGLDHLLEGLDSEESGSELRKRKREGDDWLQSKRRKAEKVVVDLEETDEDEDSEEVVEDGDMDIDMKASGFSEDWDGSDDMSGEEDFDGFDSEDEEEHPAPEKRIRENPYIAPVTSVASTQRQKYVPPSLRKAPDADTEALQRLRRKAQGLLNRLSEANLISILAEAEKLYQSNPRQNVTMTLLDLLLERFTEGTSGLQDTFVILHAGFIAAIYKIIGTDFGAALLERLVETFDRVYHSNDDSNTGKQPTNLIALLSQLYNLQVVGTPLVFDYIRLFLQDLTELNTELLLKIIKGSGSQLRRDDPSSLKDIVIMIQPIAAEPDADLSVRTKFMIETITDLKNNRMKTGVGASSLMAEHLTQMRKILGSLNTRNIRATEPLSIGLEDVRHADKRGKWWLVGASWKEKESTNGASTATLESGNHEGNADVDSDWETGGDEGEAEVDLAKIAKAHGMNTDVRRSIFVTLMSSADYEDAHLRLLKLRLRKAQELEIPRVLVHCVGAEEGYNPYYALVARKVCAEGGGARRLKMAFQFALWDVFKRLGERFDSKEEADDGGYDDDGMGGEGMAPTAIFNYGKFFGWMVAKGLLTLGVLKLLNFTHLQSKTKTLVELMLVTVLLESQDGKGKGRDEDAVGDIFIKVRQTPQMISGLQYFLKKVVSRTDLAGGEKKKATVKWACKVAFDTLSVAERGAAAVL